MAKAVARTLANRSIPIFEDSLLQNQAHANDRPKALYGGARFNLGNGARRVFSRGRISKSEPRPIPSGFGCTTVCGIVNVGQNKVPTLLARSSAREWFLFTIRVKRNEDIVAWADSEILADPKPDIRIIELATTPPSRTEVFMAELDRLREGADVWQAIEDGLGAVYDYVSASPKEAPRIAQALYTFASWYSNTMPDKFSFIHRFDDAFILAEDGSYGRVDDVTAEFISQLEGFKKEPNQSSRLPPRRG